jgi:hypothetical protein
MIALALVVTLLRVWARVRIEARSVAAPEYFVWAGWFFALGWFICSIKSLNIELEHPLDEDGVTDSVEYLKVRDILSLLHTIICGRPSCTSSKGSSQAIGIQISVANFEFPLRSCSYRATYST